MKYGLIGEALSHSFSKQIHEQLAPYTYEICPLAKEEFHTFMKQRSFQAINVTIPYKMDVIPYLDELDEKAKQIGAVNTIVKRHGKLYGTNTDYDGFLYTLKAHQIDVHDKSVLILGDGGAAQAVKAVCRKEGCKSLISVRRSPSPATITYELAKTRHKDIQIIINTTPSGMFPDISESCANLNDFPACEAVVDIIYNPLSTRLCIQAKEKGIPYAGGLEMLIAQAKYAVEYFTGSTIEDACIDSIYRSLYKEKQSIVLIGMPSCGKSTLGKALAASLQRPFIDLDQELEQREQRTIKRIIQAEGEAKFRDLEQALVKEISTQQGLVIATGGGVVKRQENMQYLAMNGWIVYVKRDVEALLVSDDRPLSSSKEAIQTLYDERKQLYEGYSDITVDNNQNPEDALHRILMYMNNEQ